MGSNARRRVWFHRKPRRRENAGLTLRLRYRRRRIGRLHLGPPAQRRPHGMRCCCSRPAAGIATRGSTSRSAGAASSSGGCTTGCISPSPSKMPTAGASNAPAARSSAAARRSTRWPMCAAIAATTTAGRGPASTGWSYADVLPYFRRQESWEGGADDYRGGDGPLTCRHRALRRPDHRRLPRRRRRIAAAATPTTTTARSRKGLGRMQQTIRHGRRCSAAEAYLRPALARANLTVETGALAHRIVLDRGRAIGIEYERRGATDRGAGRARGDPVGRRHQLAAAA